jgi:hypothetical protein
MLRFLDSSVGYKFVFVMMDEAAKENNSDMVADRECC